MSSRGRGSRVDDERPERGGNPTGAEPTAMSRLDSVVGRDIDGSLALQ